MKIRVDGREIECSKDSEAIVERDTSGKIKSIIWKSRSDALSIAEKSLLENKPISSFEKFRDMPPLGR